VKRRNVLHLVDTLEIGGAERVAVNLVNVLPRSRYRVALCTTRRDGPLADLVADDVQRLCLGRTKRFEPAAVANLVGFVRQNDIQLLHAHGTAIFLARLAGCFPPYPSVVWHDHFGRFFVEERPVWLYRLATGRIGGVIAVNETLAEWSRSMLRMRTDRVWYMPNFVPQAVRSSTTALEGALPGEQASRIVCVANFRPQKDHSTLLAAMQIVVRTVDSAHLLLAGEIVDRQYFDRLRSEIRERQLDRHVTVLGARRDVPAILRASAVGVLSSASEGLPLALIEYGAAGLASVATAVGQCPDVLDHGEAGLLVPPADPEALASAIVSLLTSPERRQMLAARLSRHTEDVYGEQQATQTICNIYDQIFGVN